MTEQRFSSRCNQPLSGRMYVVEDSAAAAYLTHPASQRYFTPFLARERTASDVARELDVDTGSVTYRINRMLNLGLLTQTRLTPRAGRALRHYRSVADEVFIPLALTPTASLAELFARGRADTAASLSTALERAWLQLGSEEGWGTHLYRHADGVLNRDFLPRDLLASEEFWRRVLAENAPAVWDQYAQLHLSHTQAKQMQHDLADLIQRYAKTSDRGRTSATTPHLIHLALAPCR